MRHYLLYSSSIHFLLLAVLFFAIPRGQLLKKKNQTFFIDFIGGSQVVSMQDIAKTARPAAASTRDTVKTARPAPTAVTKERPDEDNFDPGELPKPSVLAGNSRLFDPAESQDAGEARNTTALITDSANFPYPWYIAQVREALWNAWTGKMPSGGDLRCTVKFTIPRQGAAGSVSVEKSSGNRLFDYAAETSAHSAAPFPPLPDDFFEDNLTVHVEFKAGD